MGMDQLNRLYQIPVPIWGLTGGIATGKSTVANLLLKQGYPIIDADRLVKNIYKKKEVIVAIEKKFGERVIHQNQINFLILRELAFSTPDNIAFIESLIYQYMPDEFMLAFVQFKKPPLIIYDVPLLFEKKLDKKVDRSILVYTSRANQLKRLSLRDNNSTPETLEKILNSQMDIELKKQKADLVIDNSSTLESLESQVRMLFPPLAY